MPCKRKHPERKINPEGRDKLVQISQSRTESASRIERAKIILEYAAGVTVSAIARPLSTNRPQGERWIDKALHLGALTALDDLPRSGKPLVITPKARAWLISIACQKPKDLGYSLEVWPNRSGYCGNNSRI